MISRTLDGAPRPAPAQPGCATLLVTSPSLHRTGHTRRALAASARGARIRRTGFRGVLLLEAEGDALELAARLQRECAGEIGRVVAVCAQVRASAPQLREAAVRVGAEQIGGSDSFCFRIRKRGAHQLDEDTAVLEREIGSAIWVGLERKHGRKPRVDLENPDVTIRAEVLGPIALVGVQRKSWSRSEPETREEYR